MKSCVPITCLHVHPEWLIPLHTRGLVFLLTLLPAELFKTGLLTLSNRHIMDVSRPTSSEHCQCAAISRLECWGEGSVEAWLDLGLKPWVTLGKPKRALWNEINKEGMVEKEMRSRSLAQWLSCRLGGLALWYSRLNWHPM